MVARSWVFLPFHGQEAPGPGVLAREQRRRRQREAYSKHRAESQWGEPSPAPAPPVREAKPPHPVLLEEVRSCCRRLPYLKLGQHRQMVARHAGDLEAAGVDGGE